jgi:hypothetical protein
MKRFLMIPDGKPKDAKGRVCTQTACPKCHQILPNELVAALTEHPKDKQHTNKISH